MKIIPPKTVLPNKFKKYCIIKPYEWHNYRIGYYHVSSIGCGHPDLEPDKHSGPCLLNTFYDYINPAEQSVSKQGNFWVGGELWHPKLEEIAKINNPFFFPEFPLQRLLQHNNQKLIILGSVDLPRQKRFKLTDDPKAKMVVDILDIKTSSEWTFPKDNSDKNPTHYDQVDIYSAWLQNYYFDSQYIQIGTTAVIYANKHEAYIGEQFKPYDNDDGIKKYLNFIDRAFKLDYHLQEFMNVIKLMGERRVPDVRERLNACLPEPEPHHWCKFCNNRHRCRDKVFFEEDTKILSLEEIENLYTKQTGKSPIWRDHYTRAFESFKHKFKTDDDEL